MTFFSHLSTVNDIKLHYRKLCMQHHPDRGGDTSLMQLINAEYHSALKRCNNQEFTGTDNKQRTYHYRQNVEQAVMDKISEIVSVGMVDVEIMLIGHWIWITGDTRQYARQLGKDGLKMRWHPKRKAWYWHLPSKRKYRFNAHVELDDLAASYGYQSFDSRSRTPIG